MFFQVAITVCFAAFCTARTCIRNHNDVTFIGDSRWDQTRVALQSWDYVGTFKGILQAKNGQGILKMFNNRFPGDYYSPTTKYRVLYVGVNDCTEPAPGLPASLTVDTVFAETYRALCSGDTMWTDTAFGHANSFTVARTTALTGFDTPVYIVTTAGMAVVGLSGTNAIYKMCTIATAGTLAGVTLPTTASCGWYNGPLTINGFSGQIWVSRGISARGTNNVCVSMRPYSSVTCNLLDTFFSNPGYYIDTPHRTGNLYPADGFDALHGSTSVRQAMTDLLDCTDVDWSATEEIICEHSVCPKITADVTSRVLENEAKLNFTSDKLTQTSNTLHNAVIEVANLQAKILELASKLDDNKQLVSLVPINLQQQIVAVKNETFAALAAGQSSVSQQIQNGVDDLSFFTYFGIAGFGVSVFLFLWQMATMFAKWGYVCRHRNIPPTLQSVA